MFFGSMQIVTSFPAIGKLIGAWREYLRNSCAAPDRYPKDGNKYAVEQKKTGLELEAPTPLPERPEQPSLLGSLNEQHAAFYAEQGRKLQEQLTETTLKIALE
jgi:hypothetical protein